MDQDEPCAPYLERAGDWCRSWNGDDAAMQAVAVGFIIGVIQDSMETALNSSGDVFFTATAEYYDRKKRGHEE